MAKGNYPTNFYVCANMNYDLGCYDEEFQQNEINPILYGRMFFADFAHLKPPELLGAIVEVHGLGPGWINVGIYTDDLGNIPSNAQVRLIFEHIGGLRFCKNEELRRLYNKYRTDF